MEVEKSQNQLQFWRWEPKRASYENQESRWYKFHVSLSLKTGWNQCPNSKEVREKKFSSTQPFCSTQTFNRLDDITGESNLFYSVYQFKY